MKPRILIVEDEPYTAAAIQRQLSDLGFDPVAVTSTGEEALRLAADLQIDLALVDLCLDGKIDGIETASLLRRNFNVESVFMSGCSDPSVIDKAIAAAPYGFIPKPVTTNQLKLSMGMALQRLQMEGALTEREQQLKDVLRTSMDAFWVFGLDGRVIEVNEAACRMTGYTRQELLKMNLVQLEYGRTPEQIANGIERVLTEGTAQFERLTKRKDGQIRIIELSMTCSPAPMRRLYCFGRDITERRRSEETLREREQHLRAIIDTIPSAVWLKDNDGRYLAVNSLWRRIYRKTEEQVLGKTDFDFFPANEAATYSQRDKVALKSATPVCAEVEHCDSRGNNMWLEVWKARVLDEHDRCVGLVGITLDITHRRESQKRLQLLHRAVEQSPISIIITDTVGKIEYVNPFFEKQTGYTLSEAVGQNPRFLNSGVHPKEFFTELWTTISSGNEWRGEIRNRRKDGSLFWEQALISPVRDENGAITSFIAVKENVTARKAAELTMAWQAALVENSVDICCVKGLDLRVLTANQAMADAAGVASPSELIGKTDAEIFKKAGTAEAQSYMEDEKSVQRLNLGQVLVREEKLHSTTGEERVLLTRKFPVFSHEGKLIATANISTDITDFKRAEQDLVRAKEEAEAANRAKSRFLATMSHELRTPLNVINGMASILSQSSWPGEQQHAIAMIAEGGSTLLTIIEEILDYSGLQAGKTKLDLSPFSVLSVTSSALRLFGASVQAKGINLTSATDPNIPAELVGDPRRLQQVLVNLLQNAIKFTEQGRVHLRVAVASTTDTECILNFSVRDTGIGIAPENLAKLFKPFSQADDTITRRFGGTGLGLAISKSFIELMGGRISARSKPGRGSEFRFSVKFGFTPNRTTALAHLALPAFRNRHVLVSTRCGDQQRALFNVLRAWQMQPFVFNPQGCHAEPGYCDVAILTPAPAHQPNAVIPGTCPIVWLARKDSGHASEENRTTFFLGSALDPIELASSLTHLFSPPQPTPAKKEESPHSSSPSLPLPISILAAEDNRTNREVIKLILRHLGYSVDLVVNGAEAVAAVQRKKYDLLLLDVQMPVMDGLTAAREICRLFPDAATRVRMAALTANALPGDRELCLAAGMDEYLSKPILPADLRACIQRMFRPATSAPAKPAQSVRTDTSVESLWVDGSHLETITAGLSPEQIVETLTQLHASVCNDFNAAYPQIRDLCERRDQKQFAETVHGLKGCFMMTGWIRAGKRCAQALGAARQGNFNGWLTFPQELRSLFEQSNKAMTEHLALLQRKADQTPQPVVDVISSV
ncbi:MAG: PAS domain S-box protein [Nibricoccus sp.]